MTKCYICNRKGSKTSNLSFHRFPAEEESIQKWLEIIGKSDPPPGKRSTVCSLHFTEDCFRYGLVYGMRRLKEGSNPSLYLQETVEESIMLNKRHKTSVNQTLDEIINNSDTTNFEEVSLNAEENLENVHNNKSNFPKNENRKRKSKESEVSMKKIKLNLTWEKIISAPDGGKRYWECAQQELNVRKNRIKALEMTLRRTKQKLLEVQTTIIDLKEKPFVTVYLQEDR